MRKTISGLPIRLFAYITATVLVAVPVLVISLVAIALHPPGWRTGLPVLLFALLSIAADLRPVPMNADGNDELSIGSVFIVTTAVLFGVRYAAPVAAISIAIAVLAARIPWYRVVFNVAMYALAGAAAGLPVFLYGPVKGSGALLTGFILLGAAAHLAVNVVLIAFAISLSQETPWWRAILPGLRHGGAAFAIMPLVAALAANLWRLDPPLLVLLAGPLFTIALYQRTALRSRIASRDALTDNLTGLGNHRAYQVALRQHVSDAEQVGDPFSLCLVDVDDFKRLNDTYGHPVGDEVLARIARLLDETPNAMAFRFGGDEFAVLVQLDDAQAYELLAIVQRRIAHEDLCEGQTVTISVGIASCPGQAEAADDLQRTADEALYWSKANGKNRSFVYNPTIVRLSTPEDLQRKTQQTALLQAAKNLVRFVDAKDPSTANHSQIVSLLAESIARELGLDAVEVERLRLAGLLHDLGKIGVPDHILHAPRSLTADEFEIVKKHPEIGYSLLEDINLDPVDTWVLHHHEHWDGSGYPHGLVGEEIPLGSRIVLVADAFEAMTANRPYRPAQPVAFARAELRAKAGIQFDPIVVDALERTLEAASDDVLAAAV